MLDIKMPGMDGYELCGHLKNDEQTKGIPVIFMSALGDSENITEGFAVGGVDYKKSLRLLRESGLLMELLKTGWPPKYKYSQ